MYAIEEKSSIASIPSTPPPAYERDAPVTKSSPALMTLSHVSSAPSYSDGSHAPSVMSTYRCTSVPANLQPLTRVPYDHKLAIFGIDKQAWSSFTLELQRAASPHLSVEVLVIGGAILLESALPCLSLWGTYTIWRKIVWNKVKKHVNQEFPEGKDTIATTFGHWNERWAHLGLEAGIELIEGKDGQNAAAKEALRIEGANCYCKSSNCAGRNCCHRVALYKRPMFRIVIEEKHKPLTS